jgi:hypothetical protein
MIVENRSCEFVDASLLECYARSGCRERLMINLLIRALIGFSRVVTLILAQSSAVFAESASERAWLEPSKFVVSVVTACVATIVFYEGLRQYRRAQEWKRAEFLANEIKELLADRKAANALMMIDWGARRIKLDSDEKPTLVTYRMQAKALLPHTFAQEGAGILIESSNTSTEEANLRNFTPDEALIRDCYDALLDRLDRLGSYIETGLLSASDMRPYLGYYIDELAAPTNDPTEAFWNLVFFTYVHFYHFRGIPILFQKLGHDISPGSSVFQDLTKKVEKADQELAQNLAKVAQREWKDTAQTHPSKFFDRIAVPIYSRVAP